MWAMRSTKYTSNYEVLLVSQGHWILLFLKIVKLICQIRSSLTWRSVLIGLIKNKIIHDIIQIRLALT